jgi:ribosomal-protein-alanine N-acetyltransferase
VLKLRLLELGDARALLDYYERNKKHLQPWSPTLPDEFYSVKYQLRRLENYFKLAAAAEEFRFGVFDEEKLVASINLTAIEYGAFMNGRFGYSVDAAYLGQGVATSNIQTIIAWAKDKLTLHRLEANVMPSNNASRRVLEKCGFEKIGHSPKMVKINGVWEDHDMYARLA